MNPMGHPILIVNQTPFLGESIPLAIKSAGFDCLCAHNLNDIMGTALEAKPILILLDCWQQGPDLIKHLKQDSLTCNTPILMLTPKKNVEQLLPALEAGADDCMTKPFSHNELVARIQAILRRSTQIMVG